MNLLTKIIFITITLLIFVFLTFISYFSSSNSNITIPEIKNYEIWKYGISKDEKKNLFSINKINEENESNMYLEKINISDKIIYSTWSIETSNWSWFININLSNWIYLLDLNEINSKYKIKTNWVEIKNIWPWSFFINNINPYQNIIFSLNTILDIDLVNIKNNEIISNIDLYPNTYIILNPAKNIFTKNADLSKISQIFSLNYLPNNILESSSINENFLKTISLNKDNDKDFFINTLLFKKQTYTENQNKIDELKSLNIAKTPGEDIINKYYKFFINPNKKILFYKNIITKNLYLLTLNEQKDKENIKIIKDYYLLLKQIDNKEAKETFELIKYNYNLVNLSINNNIKKQNLSKLIKEIENKNFSYEYESLIDLENSYLKYNLFETKNFYTEISLFREKYFKELNIDLNADFNKNIYNFKKTDYLLFFLENLILTSNFSSWEINTKDLISIFDDYIKISSFFYISNNDEIKRIWLYTNSKILKKFTNILEEKYFEKQRDKDWLIIIKENEKIEINDIVKLETNISKIFSFFKEYKDFLNIKTSEKDKKLVKFYNNVEEKYTEYFFALKDYKKYLIEYNETKKQLLTTKWINEVENKIEISENKALEYIKSFNNIWYSNIDIKIMDYSYCLYPEKENENKKVGTPYCYKIDNINIAWKNISFLLYPLEANKISNIYINNKEKKWSYVLDNIKIDLDEKFKNASEQEERKKYDFKNFLVNTFWNQISENNKKIVEEKNIIEEEPIIRIFKRDKLFWQNWDFSKLWNFLKINYNDVLVKENNNEYEINIVNSKFSVNIERDNYGWIFESEYNFIPKHSFINPSLKLIDERSERELLSWNKINIIWEYKVNNISEEIKKIFWYYNQINNIISSINEVLYTSEINIEIIKESKIIELQFYYKNKKIKIEILDWYIKKVYYNENNILDREYFHSQIKIVLNKIKKEYE